MLRIRGLVASCALALVTMLTGTLGFAVTTAQAAEGTSVTAAHSTSQATSAARRHCHRHGHRCHRQRHHHHHHHRHDWDDHR